MTIKDIDYILSMDAKKQETVALALTLFGLAWYLSLLIQKGDTTNDQK